MIKSTKKFRWKKRDIILLFERLELYLSAGLPIDKALLVASQGILPAQCRSLELVTERVRSGALFSTSLSDHVTLTDTVIGLIRHGESSGDLSRAIGASRSIMEKGDELRRKCLSALIYPISIGAFALILTIGLVRGVMPQIIPLLKSLHVSLPLLTRMVMGFSEFVMQKGLYVAVGAGLGVLMARMIYSRSKVVKRYFHSVCMSTPIIGAVMRAYSWSIFLGSCGTLVGSGISLPDAYENSAHYIPLHPLRDVLSSKTQFLRNGGSLAEILSMSVLRMPAHVAPLISAGEMSGTLGTSLMRASSIIDRDMDHSLKKMTVLIEPVMMAGIGVIVGSIALSIMLPIYDMSRVLQQ